MTDWWVKDLKWRRRFYGLAAHVADWSKDPSSRVGCVIVDRWKRVVATGYNGLPMRMEDTAERLGDRDLKYPMTVHAEMNALLTAGHYARGAILFTTVPCCADCAGLVIQAGVRAVVQPEFTDLSREQRWGRSAALAMEMFSEAEVEVVTHEVAR